jgi:hypothetical protein
LAPDGKIYCVPTRINRSLIINTNNDTLSTLDLSNNIPNTSISNFIGGTLGLNKYIYFANANRNTAYYINSTNTSQRGTIDVNIDNDGITLDRFCGATVAPNGRIILCPASAQEIAIINPDSNTLEAQLTTPKGNRGAVLGFNGKIYFAPDGNNNIIEFEMNGTNGATTNTVNTINTGLSVGSGSYRNVVLAPNGKLYFIPLNESRIMVYDPAGIGNQYTKTVGDWPLQSFFNSY